MRYPLFYGLSWHQDPLRVYNDPGYLQWFPSTGLAFLLPWALTAALHPILSPFQVCHNMISHVPDHYLRSFWAFALSSSRRWNKPPCEVAGLVPSTLRWVTMDSTWIMNVWRQQ